MSLFLHSFMPLFVIGVGTVVTIVVVTCIMYEVEIRRGFQWLVTKFVMVGAAMLGLWILGIILLVSKIVGEDVRRADYAEVYTKRLIRENKRVFDELGDEKR